MSRTYAVWQREAAAALTALTALTDYAAAIVIKAAGQAIGFALPISVIAAAVVLVGVIAAGFILGDSFWGGKSSHVMSMRRLGSQIDFYMFSYSGFKSGHLCKTYTEVQTGKAVIALRPDGVTQYKFECHRLLMGSSCGACIEIEPNSDERSLADVRRFVSRHGIREFFGDATVYAFFAAGILAAAATFVVLLSTLTPLRFAWLSASAFGRLGAILRKTALPPRLSSWEQMSEIPTGSPVAVQLSDLHITSKDHAPFELVGSPVAPTSPELRKRLSHILDLVRMQSPVVILFSGDLTDSGHVDEWEALRESIANSKVDLEKCLGIPGNHDVQILIRHAEDGNRFASARSNPSFLKRQNDCYAQLSRTFPKNPIRFPTMSTIEEGEISFDLICMDSCRYESNWLLSNSVGRIGNEQFAELKVLLQQSERPKLVILHHHVGWYESMRRDSRDALMCTLDGKELLELLAEHSSKSRAPCLVLHGHKHMSLSGKYQSKAGVVYVQGCPSSTLGSCESPNSQVDGESCWVRVWLVENQWLSKVERIATAQSAQVSTENQGNAFQKQ